MTIAVGEDDIAALLSKVGCRIKANLILGDVILEDKLLIL
jgi:hypothetical protein